jgi:C-terminal processing protease CtpA/Prc
MWVDDLRIFVDGKDIGELKSNELEVLDNQENNEFDKGSNITIEQLNTISIEDLSALGLIWGFLIYYHPNVAKGNYNWDYELFKIIPPILNSKNKVERDEIFVKWINDLGKFSEAKEETSHDFETKIKPDLNWIKNGGFSNELSTLLLNVKNANRTGQSYYIGFQTGGNPDFKNENPYSNKAYPDVGFRLLALYRYWNIIQYYFPYKNLIAEDWKKVLKEFIPKIVNVKNETEYILVILELIGRIHDTHATILDNNQILANYLGKQYAPVELTFIENKPIVTGFYDKKLGGDTELEIGDILTKINNVSVTEIVKNTLKYTPASNYPTQLRDIAQKLLRSNDSVINVEFVRNSKIQKKVVKTYSDKEIQIPIRYLVNDTCFKMLNKEIAYINNGSLKKAYLSKIWEEIRNTKGLIIDDRNYPSDFPIYDLSNYLMPDAIPFVKFSVGNIETPGLFTLGNAINAGKKNESSYKGKVILLVNEQTQSSAEFHAMAYRVHPNALVVGSTTAGADGDVSFFSLPGGIRTAISGIGIYYPDGRETQRTGIVPDIDAKPTIKGIKENRDEVLEKAIEIINKSL